MGAATAIAMGAGTLMQASAEAQAAKANRANAEFNARVLDAQATDAVARGEEQVDLIRRDARQLRGAQRAALASQGVTLDSATAEALQRDTEQTARRNVATTRANAVREAWGLRAAAASTRYGGRMAYRAGMNASAGSLLTGGASTAAAYRDYRYRGRGT